MPSLPPRSREFQPSTPASTQPCARPGTDGAGEGNTQLRQAQKAVLAELSSLFGEAGDDRVELLQVVTARVAARTGDGCVVRLLTADGQAFGPAQGRHPDSLINQVMKHLDRSIPRAWATATFDAAIDRRRSVRLPLTADVPGYPPEMMEHLHGHPLAVGVSAPLIARGRVIGILTLVRLTGADDLSVQDEAFLHDLAAGTALALDNADLFRSNRELTSQMKMLAARTNLLLGIAQEFSASILNQTVLLDLIARRLAEAVDELATIRLVSDDGKWFEPSSIAWHADPDVRAAALCTLQSRLPVDDGPLGQALTSRVPLRVEQVELGPLGLRSLVVVPILFGDRVLAVASVGRCTAGRPYGDDDLQLLKDVAAHAGIAIANSRLIRHIGA